MITKIPPASLAGDIPPVIEAQQVSRTLDVGVAASIQPTLLQGSPTPVWSSPNLPAWASINASTGEVTGTPTAEASLASIDIVATISSIPASDAKTFQFEVVDSSADGDVKITLVASQASIEHGDTVNFHFELVDGSDNPVNAQGSDIQPRLYYVGTDITDSSEIIGDATTGVPVIPLGQSVSSVFSMTFNGPTTGNFSV